MYEGPEFRHLTHFIAVAEECNIGKAAIRLRTTQPNLTRTIKQLEQGLNQLLFTRSKSGSGLTAAGREFLPFARHMLDLRAQSVRAISTKHSGIELPLRFGYSPFINHGLVTSAMTGFCELVPEGKIEPTSECTGDLLTLIHQGHLEAALVSLPVHTEELFVHKVCSEDVMVCMRADDATAELQEVPQALLAQRLRIMFAKVHHPLFHEKLTRKLAKAGIRLTPSAFISAPSELQYLVESRKGWGFVRRSTPLLNGLVAKRIADLRIQITTAFVCRTAQQRPVLPLLAYNLAQHCREPLQPIVPKKPSGRVTELPSHSNKDVA